MIEAFCLFYNTLTFPMLRVEPAECIAEVSLERGTFARRHSPLTDRAGESAQPMAC
jgi:hypothetical protein